MYINAATPRSGKDLNEIHTYTFRPAGVLVFTANRVESSEVFEIDMDRK